MPTTRQPAFASVAVNATAGTLIVDVFNADLPDNLNQVLDKLLKDRLIDSKEQTIRLFFGRPDVEQLENLGRQIFELFPCPILNVTLKRTDRWLIESIRTKALNTLSDQEERLIASR